MDNYEKYQRAREERKRQQERRRRRKLVIVVLLLAVLIAGLVLWKSGRLIKPRKAASPISAPSSEAAVQTQPTAPTELETEPVQETEPAPEEDDDWMLVLVNRNNPLPEGFTVELKALQNEQFVDDRIYPELQKMFDDARDLGYSPLINESFRSHERQQEIMDAHIASYESSGYSHEDAVASAETEVAIPGTSEHELGLALDITTVGDIDPTSLWSWLAENSWKYGFILRYPEEKTDITGITYEPWHFRYVGKKAAEEIYSSGVCLEEYLTNR
ncbi:MAG: M15 family metallopeptidase [Clostridia bacterium]|nr:M15 family metallopeptidase [Clostridia bacterium]